MADEGMWRADEVFLIPNLAIAVKLGSIVRHTEEFFGGNGKQTDAVAIQAGLMDPDVKAWMALADRLGLLPVKR